MLDNKVVIVTGGSGLIGRELVADIIRKNGIPVNFDILAGDNQIDRGELSVDLSDPQSVVRALQQVYDRYGRIDGLVNNAYPRTKDWGTKFEDIPFESWQKNVNLQLNCVFYITQQTLKYMSEKKQGAIVNIASIYGVVGNDFTLYEDYGGTSPAAYSAIKGGIINFTRYLASYYGRQGIRVNTVSPGGIFDSQHPSFVQKYENKVPLGRMGNPEDIAPAVSFLLSDDAGYITGQNLVVDGGWTAI